MTLEELQIQAEKDLKINDTELDLESLKTPQLHNTYLKHLQEKSGNTIQVKQTLVYIKQNLLI